MTLPTRPPERFRTDRLRLRKPTVADAPAIFRAYAADPDVARYTAWTPHRSVATVTAFLKRCERNWRSGHEFTWAILPKGRSQPIGMASMRIMGHQAGLGYVLARAHWGQGYMTEVVTMLADWAIARPAIHRVWACCDVENPASARVMEKAGLAREGVLRRWLMHPNMGTAPRDGFVHARVK